MFGLFNRTQEEDSVTTAEVHTPENPYCDDITCWCQTNVTWHTQVTEFHAETEYSEEEVQTARRFFGF